MPGVTARPETAKEEIHWLPWREAVFERARREDKLILFDSGATWCHWCHVMDRLTYEDRRVVAVVRERFIAVRIDRDRLPEVDRHFQSAPALVGDPSAGGWPLTVVLTPDGHVLFKGTFIPPEPEARFGRLGMLDLLDRLDGYWRANREEISRAGEDLRRRAAEHFGTAYARPGDLSAKLVEDILAGVKGAYDSRHGGFGDRPKFFAAASLELLALRAWRGDTAAAGMLAHTLAALCRGGICDQLAGGFHRYSVDERWHVPHFEKMAYDNAALLALCADAFALTGEAEHARAARETIAWVDRLLRDGGDPAAGFYASQDADVGLDDDGDYFTWTVEEVRAALGDRAELAGAYYGIDPVGDVHGRAGRNVLHRPKTVEQLAKLLERDEAELAKELAGIRAELLSARRNRPAPRVDKTVFADLNGMMIDAYLTAFERLGDDACRRTALAALDGLLATGRDERGVFAHFHRGGELRGVGLLADQAWMGRALVHAFALTGKADYLRAAGKVADYVLAELVAPDGAFLTAPPSPTTSPAAPGAARPWLDAPVRSAASTAAQMLIDLAHLAGKPAFAAAAAKALGSFAGAVDRGGGTMLGGYALAVDHCLNGPRTIVVVGPAGEAATAALADAARRAYVPGGLVVALDPAVADHAALLERLGYAPADRPVAYVCQAAHCLRPAFTRDDLAARLRQLAAP